MKQKLIQQLHNLIYEHELSNYCTDYDKATQILAFDSEQGFDCAYDVGRYDTLKEVLQIVQKMEA